MTDGEHSWSWYCSKCLKELGVDLEDKDGEPKEGCPEHGKEYLTCESWDPEDVKPISAIQWAPSGNFLEGNPVEVLRFVSTGGVHRGFGGGPGFSMIFGTADGDISVNPKQWIVKYNDGSIKVEDSNPLL